MRNPDASIFMLLLQCRVKVRRGGGEFTKKLGIVSNGESKALILKPSLSHAALSQSNSFQPWDVGSR